jgi:hypothetical protein
VHDERGKQAVNTAFVVSNVQANVTHLRWLLILHEGGREAELVVVLQRFHD